MSSPTSKKREGPEVVPRQTIQGHTGWVMGVVHLPGRRRILTGSEDGSLRLWDLESGTQIGEDWKDEGEKAAVWAIALSPNGKTVASGSDGGIVRLWDIEKGKVVTKWAGDTNYVLSVCWSGDGERVLSVSDDGTARVWDVKIDKTVLTIKTGHHFVYTAIYSPDSTKIGTGGYNENALKIWDAKTGDLLDTLKHDRAVSTLTWTSDEKKLISGTCDGPIRIFDTATWQQIAILESHLDTVRALSLFQNGRLLASVSFDHTARIWDLDTNLPVGPPLQHKEDLRCATLSVDGKLLVTGSTDKNAYVWDIHAILKEAGSEDLLFIPSVPARESLLNSDATRRSAHLKDARRLPPGFFDDSFPRCSIDPRSSANHRALTSSLVNPRALLGRFFHRSHSGTGEAVELQQRPRRTLFSPHGPHVVEVPAVQDKRPLAVTRPPEPRPTRPRPVTTLWAYLVLLLCCASPQMVKRTQQQKGQSQDQAQASSSQTQPAAPSSTTPPSIAPGGTGTQS